MVGSAERLQEATGWRPQRSLDDTLRALFEMARARGDATFLVYEDERWSFDLTRRHVAALGHVLRDRYGVRHGDRVRRHLGRNQRWFVAHADTPPAPLRPPRWM